MQESNVLTPEQLYLQLGNLVAEMPDLAAEPNNDTLQWLARVIALVEAIDRVAAIEIKLKATQLGGTFRHDAAQAIYLNLQTALAKTELAAPSAARGRFIAAGNTFDAFAAVGRVLGEAKAEAFFIDPYADEKVLTEYAIQSPEGVTVAILADEASHKRGLAPATDHWKKQFGPSRPLEVRLAPAKTLHDRLILIDKHTVWTLGQSFNKLAERAHTSLVRVDSETAQLKIAAYRALWLESKKI